MTLLNAFSTGLPLGVGASDSPRGLLKIHKPGCAARIWERQPLPAFQAWINSLCTQHLPQTRLILHASRVQDAMQHTCNLCGTPDGPERALLVDDIAALADIFASAIDCNHIRLRLDVVVDEDSRPLELNQVTARLVCAYRGQGLQYTGYTVPTCCPILLRGGLWANDSVLDHAPWVPPGSPRKEPRLVLTLDAVSDLKNAAEAPPTTCH